MKKIFTFILLFAAVLGASAQTDLDELKAARDTYDANTLIYQYLDSVITKGDAEEIAYAKENYKKLTNIKFSEGKNEYWYCMYICENGVVVANQSGWDQLSLITAYPSSTPADSVLWKFEGSYKNGIKMISKYVNSGKSRYVRFANKVFQTIRDSKKAQSLYFSPAPAAAGRVGWNIKTGKEEQKSMNPNSGAFGGRTFGVWNITDPNNAFGFVSADDITALTNGNDIENGAYKNVSVNRIFSQGWGTVCLPFDVTAGQFKANFGDDAEVYDLSNASGNTLSFKRKNVSQYNNSTSKLRDNTVVMSAGTPYLIKVSADVTNPIFIQAKLNSAANNVAKGDVTFKGNYEQNLSSENLYGVVANGQVKSGSSDVNFGPWTAYFETATTGAAKAFNLSVDGESIVTAISGIKEQKQIDNNIYDLMGRKVSKPQHGVYILNGKKIIIK